MKIRSLSLAGPVNLTIPVLALFVISLIAATPQANAKTLRIVALGDSLTAGYRLPRKSSFPAQLQRSLRKRGHQVKVINAGVSGDTAASGLARLDWAVDDRTDAVILELGANDALRGLDPAQTRKALETIITRLKQRKIPILITGMRALPSLGGDYVDSFDTIYGDLAKKHGLLFYPFFLDGVALDTSLNLDDGIHPNKNGVRKIVTRILPKVEELIKQIK